MANEPNISMKMQEDRSLLFEVRDGVTVRVSSASPTQVNVEIWRDSTSTIVPMDSGNIGTQTFRDKIVKKAKEYLNPPQKKNDNDKEVKQADTVPHLAEDLDNVATLLNSAFAGRQKLVDMIREEPGTTIVDRLIDCVEEVGTLFVTPRGRAHAALEVNGHTETHEIESTRFRVWLRGYFYQREKERLREQAIANRERMIEQFGAMVAGAEEIKVGRPPVVKKQTIEDAVDQLQSMARFSSIVEDVHIRTARRDGKVYVDLGSDRWDAVEVDSEGWRIVENPPVRFVRSDGHLQLPYPVEGGSLESLRDILTLSRTEEDDKDKSREEEYAWRLIQAWMVQALGNPGCRHYPILILMGSEGSSKSTTGRMIRSIVDPNEIEDTNKPKSAEDLQIDAECSWVVAVDNISGLPLWLSDALCRIATGSGMTKRTLYTDRDRQLFKARRPQLLNGIAEVAKESDLLRRSLLVNLPPIKENREESEVYAELELERPAILGALLTAVSGGLKSIEDGEEISTKLPSMSDFAKWAIRCERSLGIEAGGFMEAYLDSKGEATVTALESEAISATFYKFAEAFDVASPWEGTVEELRKELNYRADDDLKRSKDWPNNSKTLGIKLKRLKKAFADAGVIIEYLKRTSSGQPVRVYHEDPDTNDDDYGEV